MCFRSIASTGPEAEVISLNNACCSMKVGTGNATASDDDRLGHVVVYTGQVG